MSQSSSPSRPIRPPSETRIRKLLPWGATTGFGLGGALDVVMFHLILQQHHLLSGYIDPQNEGGLSANVYYDGVFLLVMLAVTGLGLVMLWRWANGASGRLSNTFLAGTVLLGAGVFNVLDGVVSHYVLGVHDVVHETGAWNPHWVVVSVLLLGTGVGLIVVADSGGKTTS
jgi:uncharacterized membrane protein